ncbi:hypothetical protein AS156_25800 [Bradyrhizobium macuxiense]|uniref:Uncharacterized protein n=1 Tax=Bradyrhizobium macuxiense TaxID=1755647 RepID=A0A109K5T5_9BRAD|nr:hypothetical protein AS156_25800 [Bradyrhizobium macuxiense]
MSSPKGVQIVNTLGAAHKPPLRKVEIIHVPTPSLMLNTSNSSHSEMDADDYYLDDDVPEVDEEAIRAATEQWDREHPMTTHETAIAARRDEAKSYIEYRKQTNHPNEEVVK